MSYTVKYLREGDNKVLAPEKVVTDQTFDTEVTEQAADVVGYTPDAPSKTMILDEYNKVLTFSYSANTYDYTVRHIKQLPDGSYDEANAEVETLSGKFEALAVVTAKDYGSHYPTNDADTKQNIKIEEGLTIDVKYALDEHTLTFETNGGSAINPVTVRHGNAVARPADPTKDKYTFIGWYADPEFTEEYDFATVLEADKTIYAKFELTSTPIGDIYVRYDVLHIKQLPDGTYDLANAEVEHLSAKKDTTVTAVIKDYRATHHVNVNRTLSKLTGTAIQPYMGVDGKPVYTILSVYYDLDFHTLTFDTMGGSKIAPETVRHGLTVAKPKDPVNGGYIFDGWYTEKSGGTKITTDTVFHANATVYAHWTYTGGGGGGYNPPVTYYTLRFETGGGSDIPSVRETYNAYIDLTQYVPTWRGHTFIGWYSERGLINKVSGVYLTKDMTVYAGWRVDENPNTGANPFTDVSEKDWFYGDVMFVYENGLMLGTSKTLFSPHGTATRGMMATILWRMEGSPAPKGKNSFTDVEAGKWYADAITWTAENSIFAGYGKDKFGPDDPITREQLAAIFYRYADYKGYDLTVKGNLDKFRDADKITDYAKTAMQWAVGSGLVKGKSGNLLDPQGTATRAEIAAMLHRFIEKYELVQGKAPGGLMGWIDPKRLKSQRPATAAC